MQVSTMNGSILADLLGAKPADSFLASGDGDITVLIPSNVGVTIRAEKRDGRYHSGASSPNSLESRCEDRERRL